MDSWRRAIQTWSTGLGVCFLPLAFKNHCPRQRFVQVGFPPCAPPMESTREEQIGGSGDVRMKPTKLLCACRLMMKSRKWEGLGLWLWPGLSPCLAHHVLRALWHPSQLERSEGLEPFAPHSPIQRLPGAPFCAERLLELLSHEKSLHVPLLPFRSQY